MTGATGSRGDNSGTVALAGRELTHTGDVTAQGTQYWAGSASGP